MKKEMIAKSVKLTNIQLREHNTLLRKNLKRIVSCSTDNEKAQERMDEIEKLIFDAPSLKVMFDAVITQGRRIFEINFITVVLENELKEFYPENYHHGEKNVYLGSENIFFDDLGGMDSNFSNGEPTLRGNLKKGSDKFFPNGISRRVRSEAIVPVHANGRIIAILNFGSQDNTRFMEGYGFRFLMRLARLVALKIEMFRVLGPEFRGENADG